MGGSSWSYDHYIDRAADRVAKGVDAFAYDADVRAGRAPTAAHDKLNPKNVVRESRDSAAHPDSNAIMVWFDVTGSMGGVPRVLQNNLPQLHGLLTQKGYIPHPQLFFGAVSDVLANRVPLQVGQFESGNEMDDDLGRIYLEGGGGGTNEESYELAMYFSLFRTRLDCHEKRGRKGYLFIIGDETSYPAATRAQIASVLGDGPEKDVPVQELAAKLREKFHCYFIIPKLTQNYDAPWLMPFWQELFGQNVLKLDDAAGICELIAMTIGLNEGAIDVDTGADHIKDSTNAMIVRSVMNAVAPIAGAGGMVRVTGSALVPDTAPQNTKRL